jgi:putative membrane protein
MVVNMRQPVLSAAEHAAISAAIEAAEAKTSGEIFCVIARKSGDYSWTTLVYGIVLALLAPIAMLAFGINPLDLADSVSRLTNNGWSIGVGTSPHDEAALGMAIVVAVQALILIIVSCIGLNGDIREALTPAFIKRQNVHRAAMEQFLAHGIQLTSERTGVLIFASLSEHQAEIIADTAIFSKVDPSVWSDAISTLLIGARAGDLAGGMVGAVEKSAAILAPHFPFVEGDVDELPNKVVII